MDPNKIWIKWVSGTKSLFTKNSKNEIKQLLEKGEKKWDI